MNINHTLSLIARIAFTLSLLLIASVACGQVNGVRNLDESMDTVFDVSQLAFAQRFTTGDAPRRLATVTVDVTSASTGSSTMMLREDFRRGPGDLVEDLGEITIPVGSSRPIYTSSGTMLEANTTYWLTLGEDGGSGSYNWTGTASLGETSPLGWSLGNQVAFSQDGGSTWTPFDSGFSNESARLSINVLPEGVFVPAGLNPGDEYQLVFVTSGFINAISDDISVYNDFVNAQAKLNPSLTGTDLGVTWTAIASTPSTDARDNALVEAPVYQFESLQVASGFADLWDGEIAESVRFDQFGNVPDWEAWTGSGTDGFGLAGQELGSIGGTTSWGASFARNSEWINAGNSNSSASGFAIYALSEKLTVPAPPSNNNMMITRSQSLPVIDFGSLSFGLSELPAELDISFELSPGTSMSGVIVYDMNNVIAVSGDFGDGEFDDLQSFQLIVSQTNGSVLSMSGVFDSIVTPSVSDGVIMMNSPAFIYGTDTASGQAFAYRYTESVDTLTMLYSLGDVNQSGVADFFDIAPFIALLSAGTFQFEADINGDGLVSFLDIAPFITILSGL